MSSDRGSQLIPVPEVWQDYGKKGGKISSEITQGPEVDCVFDENRLKRAGKTRRGGYDKYPVYYLEDKEGFGYAELKEQGCKFSSYYRDSDVHFLNLRFEVEHPPKGCEQDENVKSCIATSRGSPDEIYVEIDLVDEWGIEPWVLDFVRPEIRVTQPINCRNDTSAEYSLRAHLLKEEEQFYPYDQLAQNEWPRIKEFERKWNTGEGGKAWETAEIVFKEYPADVRKIGIVSRGCIGDDSNESNNSTKGAKFSHLFIEVRMPESIKFIEKDKFTDPATPEWLGQGHKGHIGSFSIQLTAVPSDGVFTCQKSLFGPN